MLKIIAGIGAGACLITFTLLAADAWTKPYTQWSDADVQKVLNDSPWADRMLIETGQRGELANPNPEAKGKDSVTGMLTVPVTVFWQSALPIKQAFFGRATATDAQKQLLDRQEPAHILRLQGLPGSARAATQDLDKLKAASVIKIKGKPDLHPSDIQVSMPPPPPQDGAKGGPSGGGKGGFGGGFGNFDLFLVFPKDASIDVDDKEMEFVTKLGQLSIRKKFKLKEMVYNGKLEF